MLLSALVERFSVSRMRDFFTWLLWQLRTNLAGNSAIFIRSPYISSIHLDPDLQGWEDLFALVGYVFLQSCHIRKGLWLNWFHNVHWCKFIQQVSIILALSLRCQCDVGGFPVFVLNYDHWLESTDAGMTTPTLILILILLGGAWGGVGVGIGDIRWKVYS